jgi:1-phosphofructokinase family hexose kinase
MSRILTVTLNPAWDITHVSRAWPRGGVARAERHYAYAGGKGLNVARGLRDLGHAPCSLALIGGHAGELVRRQIAEAGLDCRWVEVAGETRTNLTLVDPETRAEIHSIDAGPIVQPHEWDRFSTAFDKLVATMEIVVLAGSLPRGVPSDAYARLIRAARACGARVVLDASGSPLEAALAAAPHAIKPNREELAQLVGRPVEDLPAVQGAARAVMRRGVEHVFVTLGCEGAVAVSPIGAWHASPPQVEVRNTVGCGDAFVAGLVHALAHAWPPQEQLRWAVAAGTANVTVESPGAVPAEVRQLALQMSVTRTA